MQNKSLILLKNLIIEEKKNKFSRFRQRGNSENKSFKENYFDGSKNRKKSKYSSNDQSRGKKRFGFKSDRSDKFKKQRHNHRDRNRAF